MPVRRHPISDATHRGEAQLGRALAEIKRSRIASGLSMQTVAHALGCSRQLIAALEGRHTDDVGVIQLTRLAAAVGLDLGVGTYAGGDPVRDRAQLRLLERFREALGTAPWTWRAEVPASADPRERRAMDAVLVHPPHRVGVEAITHLTDAQGQCRIVTLKQASMGLRSVVLVLADTRHNRHAAAVSDVTLRAAFPLGAREVLRALREGRAPTGNGLVLI